jgi:hypothetical protein
MSPQGATSVIRAANLQYTRLNNNALLCCYVPLSWQSLQQYAATWHLEHSLLSLLSLWHVEQK